MNIANTMPSLLTPFIAQLTQHFPAIQEAQLQQQLSQATQDPTHHLNQLAYAVMMSEFLAETLQKQPHFLHQCWHALPQLSDCNNYAQRLKSPLDQCKNEEDFYRTLRRFRHLETAKLSLCQSLNIATVEEIFIRLSWLAESLIIGARDWLYQKACEEMGTPVDSQGQPLQLYVLGMGKLGGFELNFSSDIDLIFTYAANGETIGARRSVENSKFFTRLGQRLINALDQYTPDGFVYRTDMRLRPFGDSGALALSFNAMEQYYQEQGRDWERYAMIKARILGENPHDPYAQTLKKLLRPFVYRRYIDFSVIQSLRDMKQKIEREVRRRGLVDNIKLGAGGIREIEFIVQVFQLIRGGREVRLQRPELLYLLPELEALGLVSTQERQDLQQAYVFLRRVENVLQAIKDQQTQQLPENAQDKERLILATTHFTCWNAKQQPENIHYPIKDWHDFCQILQLHQQKVRSVFRHFIGKDEEKEDKTPSNWDDFWDEDLNEEEIKQILLENGISAQFHYNSIEKLLQFRHTLSHRAIGSRGRLVLTRLLPLLLTQIFQRSAHQTLLPRMLNIVDKIVTRTTYLELLLENPQALTLLLELCEKSKLIAEQVARHPIVLDELLDCKTLLNPIPFSHYPAELQQYLLRLPQDDEEQFINALRQFKQSTLLRVAAADILGALPVMKVSDHLTYLAEVIIEAVVNLAWQQVSTRFGVPDYLAENEKGFLVIGYGKLGGIELGYKSDLDLVFLFDGTHSGQTVGGKKSIDSNQFYLKLAQKVISIFSMNTSAGILYDIDIRLRPSGDAGLLGCALAAFEHYQLNEAWTWEKQALVRSRAVYGEVKLRQQFEQIRQRVLSTPRDPVQLKQDVVQMRAKMYQHLANTNPTEFNIKTDPGGITDIEFIAQYLVLAYAPTNSHLTIWSDNVRIFEIMAESAVISSHVSAKLKQCYVQLRNKIHHLNLLGLSSVVSHDQFQEERRFIQRIWQELLGN